MRLLVPALLFLALGPLATAAPVDPRETRALALMEVLPKPRPERLAFVRDNFSPGLIARRGLDPLTGLTADLHEALGEARVIGVRVQGDALELVLRNTDDEFFNLRVAFAAGALIDGLGLMPGEPPDDDPAAQPVRESGLGAAIAKLVEARAARGFSGSVIVARDGEPVFAGAFGRADRATGREMQLDTPINLGSMNKMFTALLVGRLVEQGKLGWDDKVGKHLPRWPVQRVRDEVTIAQLLAHTSGLQAYWGEEHRRRAPELDTVAEFAEMCDEQTPLFTPGERFEYSNCGYVVLGAIIEAVTQRDYYELVREWVYRPAGMVNSDHYARDDEASGRAIGYLEDGQSNTGWLSRRGAPAGGGYASARDLLRFATALRAGRIVKPATLALLTTPRSSPGGNGPGPQRMGYGYGFGIDNQGSDRSVGHNGGAPGVNAELSMFDSGWTVIVLSNEDRAASRLARPLRRLISTRLKD